MSRFPLTIALLAVFGPAPPLAAGEAQDRLFQVDVLGEVATGQRLVFSRNRTGSFDAEGLPPIENGEIEVALETGASSGRAAMITLREAGRERSLDPISASGGHPLVLVFLESVVRDVAQLTGGSPFYIRNRMREALATQDRTRPIDFERDGAAFAGERLTFSPFTDDPNRAKLGALADLQIQVTFSDAAPGGIERLEAVAGETDAPAFSESVAFQRVEGE